MRECKNSIWSEFMRMAPVDPSSMIKVPGPYFESGAFLFLRKGQPQRRNVPIVTGGLPVGSQAKNLLEVVGTELGEGSQDA